MDHEAVADRLPRLVCAREVVGVVGLNEVVRAWSVFNQLLKVDGGVCPCSLGGGLVIFGVVAVVGRAVDVGLIGPDDFDRVVDSRRSGGIGPVGQGVGVAWRDHREAQQPRGLVEGGAVPAAGRVVVDGARAWYDGQALGDTVVLNFNVGRSARCGAVRGDAGGRVDRHLTVVGDFDGIGDRLTNKGECGAGALAGRQVDLGNG